LDPVLKVFLNSIKCPVCGGQIEGVERFFCAFSKQHYNLHINSEVTPLEITYENVKINDGRKQYMVVQEPNKTEIYVFQLNGDYEVIQTDKSKPYPLAGTFDKKLFDLTKTNREKLLNRIKTILVFS
jgi:hypothetical protein